MKIAILICGQFRALHKVYKQFEEILNTHNVDYYLSIDHDIENYNILKECSKIRQIIFQETISSNEFRNVKNYTQKVANGCKILLETIYDCYIIIRSDLIIEDPHFINKIENPNGLYVFDYNHNPFIIDKEEKINGNCLITMNRDYIKSFSQLHDYLIQRELDYFDVILYDFIHTHKVFIQMINVPSQILLFSCRVIAISGDSGSGKSRLCESLNQLFEGDQILKLETDRYHKWERGDPNYETYTHLDPAANYLQKMEDDVYNLILGDRVLAVDYDHSTGRFTPLERIHSKENIILCGLHTLWSSNLHPLLNLKIFMDTDRELIQEWKIQRDMKKRGKTLEHVKKEMARRQNDYVSYIKTQRDIADIIIKFYKQSDNIRCRCIFKNFDSNLMYMLQMCGYTTEYTSDLQIELKGKSDSMKKWMKNILVNPEKIEEGYYGEIQLIINFLEKYKHGTVIF